MHNAHIHTGMAQREASCACIVLVYLLRANQQIMMNLIQVIKIRPLFIFLRPHHFFGATSVAIIVTIAHVLLVYQFLAPNSVGTADFASAAY